MAVAESNQDSNAQAGGWIGLREFARLAVNEDLRRLMQTPESLTRLLRKLWGGDFRLRVLLQRAMPLATLASDALDDVDARGLVREVVMYCGRAPRVFAQTLIPSATLEAHPWLRELGDRPLGDVLFGRSDVRRSEFKFLALGPGEPLFERASAQVPVAAAAKSVWARRSYFEILGAPLLVNEVFFSGDEACPAT